MTVTVAQSGRRTGDVEDVVPAADVAAVPQKVKDKATSKTLGAVAAARAKVDLARQQRDQLKRKL